jgi:hypothetical protein
LIRREKPSHGENALGSAAGHDKLLEIEDIKALDLILLTGKGWSKDTV